MALATYDDLQTQVSNWLARDDLTAFIPDFITLFETDANLKLRTRSQEFTAPLTPDTVTGDCTLPDDYGETVRLTWTGMPRVELDYVHPSILQAYYPNTPQGIPRRYTIEGTTLKVRPLNATPLELVYRRTITPLSAGVNWLYAKYPNAYLWGTLAEAQGFNIDFEKMSMWTTRRDAVFEDIKLLDFRSRPSMSIRTTEATP